MRRRCGSEWSLGDSGGPGVTQLQNRCYAHSGHPSTTRQGGHSSLVSEFSPLTLLCSSTKEIRYEASRTPSMQRWLSDTGEASGCLWLGRWWWRSIPDIGVVRESWGGLRQRIKFDMWTLRCLWHFFMEKSCSEYFRTVSDFQGYAQGGSHTFDFKWRVAVKMQAHCTCHFY